MPRLSVLLPVILAVLVLAQPALAEWFADAYLGPGMTSSGTLTFTTFGEERKQDLRGRSSPVFGLRFGRWLDEIPWLGFALDVSYFRPAPDVQTVPINALVMARYGFLKDEEFTQGRLQPYVGVGGGVFISNVSGSIGFQESDDTSTDVGLDTRIGAAFLIDTNWAGFTEYRFTRVSPTWNVKVFGGETPASTTFNTHQIILGLSYRF